MRKLLKIFGYTLVLFISLFMAGLFIAYNLIDSQEIKTSLTKQIYFFTGRNLTINGNIKFSFFPWLGVKIDHIVMKNADGFVPENFMSISLVDANLKLTSLLFGQVEIGDLTLKGLEINLAKNKEGLTNWQDMVAHYNQLKTENHSTSEVTVQAHKNDPTKTYKPAAVFVRAIYISNAKISWDDQQKNQKMQLDHVYSVTKDLSPLKPFSFKTNFDFQSNNPDLHGSSETTGTIHYSNTPGDILIENIKTTQKIRAGTYLNQDILITHVGQMKINYLTHALDLTNIKISLLDFVMHGDLHLTSWTESPQLTGKLVIDTFSPVKLIELFGNPNTSFAKSNLLQSAQAQFELLATPNTIKLNNLTASLDKTHIQGTVAVEDISNKIIFVNLQADMFDADAYALSTAENTTLTPNGAQGLVSMELPLPKEFTDLTVKGDLNLENLMIQKNKLNNLQLKIMTKQGVLRISPANVTGN